MGDEYVKARNAACTQIVLDEHCSFQEYLQKAADWGRAYAKQAPVEESSAVDLLRRIATQFNVSPDRKLPPAEFLFGELTAIVKVARIVIDEHDAERAGQDGQE